MSKMEVDGIDAAVSALESLYRDTDKLQEAILDGGAAIIKDQVEKALFQSGHMDSGELLASIKIKKKTSKDGEKSRIIRPMGRDSKGVSNGYKGFVINYGKSGFTGSRFWDKGNALAEPEIKKMAEQEITLYYKQKGLI